MKALAESNASDARRVGHASRIILVAESSTDKMPSTLRRSTMNATSHLSAKHELHRTLARSGM